MTQVFLLQNQHKELLNKRGEWVDGREARSLYNSLHRDEAINQKIEVNSKDYTLRLQILECERSDKGVPLLKDGDLPPLGGYKPKSAAEPELSVEETQAAAAAQATALEDVMAEAQALVGGDHQPLSVEALAAMVAEAEQSEPVMASNADRSIGAAPAFVAAAPASNVDQAALEAGDDDAVQAQIAAMLAAQAQLLAGKEPA